jgi:2,4-dienoyl-CoA reductase (NADPH2)
LAFATTAARRGFDVTLFDAASEIGGQFNLAKQIPGKEEFYETLRYFGKQLELSGVNLKLGQKVDAQSIIDAGFKEVVLATGVSPRIPQIDGIDHPKVRNYLEVIRDKRDVGKTVALIGAGGIGFDVAEYLLHEGTSPSLDKARFFAEWGVDTQYSTAGGLQ